MGFRPRKGSESSERIGRKRVTASCDCQLDDSCSSDWLYIYIEGEWPRKAGRRSRDPMCKRRGTFCFLIILKVNPVEPANMEGSTDARAHALFPALPHLTLFSRSKEGCGGGGGEIFACCCTTGQPLDAGEYTIYNNNISMLHRVIISNRFFLYLFQTRIGPRSFITLYKGLILRTGEWDVYTKRERAPWGQRQRCWSRIEPGRVIWRDSPGRPSFLINLLE